jgi:hypothetical protein
VFAFRRDETDILSSKKALLLPASFLVFFVCVRTLLGVGAAKQWMAEAYGVLEAFIAYLCGRAFRFRTLCATARISSPIFLSFSESHETTGFFNSLLSNYKTGLTHEAKFTKSRADLVHAI